MLIFFLSEVTRCRKSRIQIKICRHFASVLFAFIWVLFAGKTLTRHNSRWFVFDGILAAESLHKNDSSTAATRFDIHIREMHFDTESNPSHIIFVWPFNWLVYKNMSCGELKSIGLALRPYDSGKRKKKRQTFFSASMERVGTEYVIHKTKKWFYDRSYT